jgi:tetratricopeptide (TPR) repeat protein
VTERLQATADTYGYIVIASNVARNGPWAPIYAAQDAMWKDVHAAFNVDDAHLYAIGFSGGARAAVAMGQRYALRGVIPCGAFSVVVPGLEEQKTQAETMLSRLPPLVFLVFGDTDMNVAELHGADALMTERGAAHWSEEFIGPHRWPDAALLGEALELMELDRRMQRGENVADFAAQLATARIASARELEKQGAPHLALHKLMQTARLFPDSAARVAAESLLPNAEGWGAAIFALDTVDLATDASTLESAWSTAENFAKQPGPLQRRAQFTLGAAPALALLRALDKQRQGDHRAAEDLLAFAAARVGHAADLPTTLYNLACAYAQLGHKREAIGALDQAIGAGFHSHGSLFQDPDLAPLRDDYEVGADFRALAKRI